jgi:hypothetical protein
MSQFYIGIMSTRCAIIQMNYNELPEFKKDYKALGKRFRSLSDDLDRFKKVLEVEPLGTDKHFAVLYRTDSVFIAKARFFCLTLKKSSLRIVYSYISQKQEICFIELYFKGDQANEDRQRIKEYLIYLQ